jgi:beta-lactamase regulating signal transducer with metallopeptidase domain/uncharacterized protein involved in exopolysaccharide biosynthesis
MNAINAEGLNEWFSGIVALSWRTGWLIVVLAALRCAVRGRIPAQVWFAVWIVVAVRLILPFSVPVAWSPFDFTIGRTAVVEVERVAEQEAGEKWVGAVAEPTAATDRSLVTVEPVGPGVAAPWSWREVALAIWLGGVVGLGGLRMAGSWSFRRELRKARRVTDGRWSAVVADEVRVSEARPGVVCLETEAVEAPAICGWFRPHLLFPPGFAAKLTDDELRFVVRHELGHWRRRDLVAQALMQAALLLHWFNPLVWLAVRLARTDCELACDEFVLRREPGGGASAYGATLLKVLGVVGERRRPRSVVGILENRRQLAERVRRIADYQRAGVGRMIGGVVLVAVVAVVSATRESRAEQPAVTPKPHAAVAVQVPESASLAADTAELARVKEVRARVEDSRKAFDALNRTVAAQRKKVDGLADALLAYKEKNNLGAPASRQQQQRLLGERTQTAVLERGNARAALTEAEIRSRQWIEYRERRATFESLSVVAGDAGVVEALRNLTEKKRAAEALGWTGVEARPGAFAEQSAAANVEAEVERASWAVSKQIEATYQAAWGRAERAQSEYQRLHQEETDFGRRMLTYTKLERDLKLAEQILRSIANRAYGTAAPDHIAVPRSEPDIPKLGEARDEEPKHESSAPREDAVLGRLRPNSSGSADAQSDSKEQNSQPVTDRRPDSGDEPLRVAKLEYARSRQALELVEGRFQQVRDCRARNEDLRNLPFIAGHPLVARLSQQHTESRTNLAALRDRYLPRSPKMIAAAAAHAGLEQELAAAVESASAQIEAEFEAAKSRFNESKAWFKVRNVDPLELERGYRIPR